MKICNEIQPYQRLRFSIQDVVEHLYSDRLNHGTEVAFDRLCDRFQDFGLTSSKVLREALCGQITQLDQLAGSDVEAAFAHDPAAQSREEIELGYPGFWALQIHRVAHIIRQAQDQLCARLLSEYAHSKTAIDIHPGATIGESFFIDHGSGVVIGETTQIAGGVTLYQGVTLGALLVERSLASQKRHPSIESNVVVYSNASILGGQTVVGHHSVIGGNVFLTYSVAPYSKVQTKAEVLLRQKKRGDHYASDFSI
ncbi:hypothetical protein P0082_09240 [Candidatus Haliotispira prima]|uniref:Serine O-acetyltransferase n=1 Tax=Candidatus Haliotispira prima TaxID=3034016 RepID=A0ABY8MF85_9SPIO|nr:hypothetical protein P0082_09240 [Candidatus Haliotispira prima]